jgi:uncharacterized membrane protein AbrB (regulator of aidB expression)
MEQALALHGKSKALQFGILLVWTVACVGVLERVRLPAALMLGTLIAAIVLPVYGGHVAGPVARHRWCRHSTRSVITANVGSNR